VLVVCLAAGAAGAQDSAGRASILSPATSSAALPIEVATTPSITSPVAVPHASLAPAVAATDSLPVVATGSLVVEFVPEMQPFPADGAGSAAVGLPVPPGFAEAWQSVGPLCETIVTRARLGAISRWAREETLAAGANWKPGWIRRLPMFPVERRDDGTILLSQTCPCDGLTLPSHSPLVFRRLLVRARFRTADRTIDRVWVTIRGWREE